MTFKTAYCIAHRCPPERFGDRVFRTTLHRRTLPVALILRRLKSELFEADFELIRAAGDATDPRQLEEYVQEYRLDSRNLSWARRAALLRISTRRLRRLARSTWTSASGAQASTMLAAAPGSAPSDSNG